MALEDVDDGLYEALILTTCRLAFLKRDADTQNLDQSREYEGGFLNSLGRLFRFASVKPGARMPIWASLFAGRPRYQGSRYPCGVNDFDDWDQ